MRFENVLKIVVVFLVVYTILLCVKEIYKFKHQGKLLVKMNIYGVYIVIWSILSVVWILILFNNISKENTDILRDIVLSVFWVLITSLNAVCSYRGSEIREDGIYHLRYYYRWDSLNGYSWISPIKLKLHTNRRFNTKIIIKEKLKSEIDEVLKQHLNEIYN